MFKPQLLWITSEMYLIKNNSTTHIWLGYKELLAMRKQALVRSNKTHWKQQICSKLETNLQVIEKKS